jgi:hypothetical protein
VLTRKGILAETARKGGKKKAEKAEKEKAE